MLEGVNEKLDLIVANLPYITTRNLNRLPEEIREWEPHVALHSGNNSKDNLYKILFAQSRNKLKPKGIIFYEIDGQVFTYPKSGGRSMGKGSGT
jgi:methylase of polypeptide subunit release factors